MLCCATPLSLVGCSAALVEDSAGETTTTVAVTTTQASTSWTLEPQEPEPVGAALLVGSWSRHEHGCTTTVSFGADGVFSISHVPDEPGYEGDGASGTWRANDTRVWVYGMGPAQWSGSYSIKGGVLYMAEPGFGGTVYQ